MQMNHNNQIQVSVCLGKRSRKGGFLRGRKKLFFSVKEMFLFFSLSLSFFLFFDRNVLYLVYSDRFRGAHICQN